TAINYFTGANTRGGNFTFNLNNANSSTLNIAQGGNVLVSGTMTINGGVGANTYFISGGGSSTSLGNLVISDSAGASYKASIGEGSNVTIGNDARITFGSTTGTSQIILGAATKAVNIGNNLSMTVGNTATSSTIDYHNGTVGGNTTITM